MNTTWSFLAGQGQCYLKLQLHTQHTFFQCCKCESNQDLVLEKQKKKTPHILDQGGRNEGKCWTGQCIRFRAHIDLQLLRFFSDFSKTPHVCFKPLSSPTDQEKTPPSSLSLVCQVVVLRLCVRRPAGPSHNMYGPEHLKGREKNTVFIRNKSAVSKLSETAWTD